MNWQLCTFHKILFSQQNSARKHSSRMCTVRFSGSGGRGWVLQADPLEADQTLDTDPPSRQDAESPECRLPCRQTPSDTDPQMRTPQMQTPLKRETPPKQSPL